MHFPRKYLVLQFSVLHFLVLHFPVLHFQSTQRRKVRKSNNVPCLVSFHRAPVSLSSVGWCPFPCRGWRHSASSPRPAACAHLPSALPSLSAGWQTSFSVFHFRSSVSVTNAPACPLILRRFWKRKCTNGCHFNTVVIDYKTLSVQQLVSLSYYCRRCQLIK